MVAKVICPFLLSLLLVFTSIGCDQDSHTCDNSNLCEVENDSQCVGETVQLCTVMEDGCLGWQDQADCLDAGFICHQDGSPASCQCAVPATNLPENPQPEASSSGVDITRTLVGWDAVDGASSYHVYFDTVCPPLAYPDPSFVPVTSSELVGLELVAETTYCWQVIPLAENGCYTEGPAWHFTTHCADDPVPGFPEVISPLTATFPSDTTEGFYLLQFSEEVNRVGQAIAMAPVNGGSGTYAGTKRVDDTKTDFRANFTGVASGDLYTLTVGTAVIDTCGKHLLAPVEITVEIE